GGEPTSIPREERRLPDVASADEPSDPALEPEREAAVWRQAVLERLQVALVLRGLAAERGHVVLVAVQPLAAGHDFEPAEEQVEGVRVLRPARLGMRVEGSFRSREAGQEQPVAVLLAKPPLVGRSEVDVVDAGVRE